ncbi:MAG: hypothetical protein MZW92_78220 [Comamonadaceae bacterium]|nr:hypothetical protein [Comamonadaceae bacterium]
MAKGRGGDHSELGARDARRFCREHGIERARTRELIEFLVRAPPDDVAHGAEGGPGRPRGDRALRRLVGTERRLTALYLLTVADIRGTSPKVWNAWKGKLLEDLYRADAARAAAAPQPQPRRRDRGAQAGGAAACCAATACAPGAEEPLWQHARHALLRAPRRRRDRLARAHRCGAAPQTRRAGGARARCRPVGEGLQVLVYAPDQPDLFARICGFFDSARLQHRSTPRSTPRAHGYALDSFVLLDPDNQLPLPRHDRPHRARAGGAA